MFNNNFLKNILGKAFSWSKKNWNLVIHNIQKAPQKVKVERKRVNINWNSEKKTLNIPVNWKTKSNLKITIKLLK